MTSLPAQTFERFRPTQSSCTTFTQCEVQGCLPGPLPTIDLDQTQCTVQLKARSSRTSFRNRRTVSFANQQLGSFQRSQVGKMYQHFEQSLARLGLFRR